MRALLLLRNGSSSVASGVRLVSPTGYSSPTSTRRRRQAAATMASGPDAADVAANAAANATPAPSFPTPSALRSWLHQHGVPTDSWGSGTAKSVEDLHAEVAAGESALFETTATTPTTTTALRIVRVVSLILSPPSSPLVLAEASQTLPDGRVRRRGLLPLSEKMRKGEDWAEAARRGVEEELGSAATAATPELVSLDLSSHVIELGPLREAASYPGLPTRYEVHRVRGELDAAAFAGVLPAALRGQRGQGEKELLEFETVEEGVSPGGVGGGVHRTTWRWVEERELGGGMGGGSAG